VKAGAPAGLFPGWYIAASCFAIYFFTNGMTLFVPQNLFPRFIETFGATAGEVSVTTSLSLGLAALLAPAVGAIVDRIGVLRAIRGGLLIMAACFTRYPFAGSLTELYWLHGLLALGFVLSGLLVNVILLSNWFRRLRGTVIGLLASASSLAGAVLPLAIAPLVTSEDWGWRWGMGALAAGFWVCAVLPGFLVLRESPAELGLAPDGDSAGPADIVDRSGRDGVSLRRALRSRALWCLAVGSACLWYSIQSLNSQVTIFLEQEAGFAAARATLVFATIFWCSFAGKFLFGAASDRLPKRRVMLLSSLLLLAGCLLLFETGGGRPALTTASQRIWAFAVIFGLGFGGSFTMIQLVAVETFGQRALGKILGLVTLIDALGAAAGTVISGQLRSLSGSYLLPFGLVALMATVAVLNVLLIRPVTVPAGRQ